MAKELSYGGSQHQECDDDRGYAPILSSWDAAERYVRESMPRLTPDQQAESKRVYVESRDRCLARYNHSDAVTTQMGFRAGIVEQAGYIRSILSPSAE